MSVDIHYEGITTRELRRISAGLGFVFVIIFWLELIVVSQVSDMPFWPGGQAEIAVMTLAAGGSVSIIMLHHIVRILLVITGAPILHQLKKRINQSFELTLSTLGMLRRALCNPSIGFPLLNQPTTRDDWVTKRDAHEGWSRLGIAIDGTAIPGQPQLGRSLWSDAESQKAIHLDICCG